jgi:plastocyanin
MEGDKGEKFLMYLHHRGTSLLLIGVVLSLLLLTACDTGVNLITNTTQPPTPTTPPTPTIAIDATTRLFVPFITVVDPTTEGTTVTFINHDTAPHDVRSVPLADPSETAFVNVSGPITRTIPAGGSITLSLTQPGLYDLYDDTQATIDPHWKRVKAKANTSGFPYAAEAVIWVKGAISGLPKTAKNSIPAGNDDFLLDFVAVAAGGKVTWHDYDTDKHFVSDPGTFGANINPAKIGDGVNMINGTADAPPNGGSTTIAFATPGLYYYYCTDHADFDPFLQRDRAHPDANIFPIPMEGFVLVP